MSVSKPARERESSRGPDPDGRTAANEGESSVVQRPGRTSVAIAIGAAASAAPLLGLDVAVPVHLLGPVVLAAGAVRGTRRLIDYGGVATVATIALAGFTTPIRPEVMALATALAILAWDAGRYGIAVGDQLGRGASTARTELVHAASTAAVGFAAVALGYGTYLLVDADGSALAVALLLAGGIALVSTLR